MCDCGCNTCETKKPALMLNESVAPRAILSEGLKHHLDANKPLTDHLYRAGSTAYFNLWAEARSYYSRGIIDISNEDDLSVLTETNLGHFGMFEGKKVPLDFPMLDEGPQFGVLYHFSEFIWDIIDDNILKGDPNVSLTRSKGSIVSDWLEDASILVLDKDKLRQNYKIIPFRDQYAVSNMPPNFPRDKKTGKFDEMEERIKGDIKNIDKYIIKVILSKEDAFKEEFTDLLKEKGIPYEIKNPLNEAKNEQRDIEDEYFIIQSLRTGSPKYVTNIEDEKPLWVPDSRIKQAYKFATLEDAKNYLLKFDSKRTAFWHIYRRPYDLSPKDVGFGRDLKNIDRHELSESKITNKKLNKPTRDSSGGKAYKVYVKDPKTGNIKTVRFGSGGLRAKINNKDARNAFAARHKCSTKKDKTKAGYWSCRLPRYAKLLGLKSNFSGFW